jgi:hypothetical protein
VFVGVVELVMVIVIVFVILVDALGVVRLEVVGICSRSHRIGIPSAITDVPAVIVLVKKAPPVSTISVAPADILLVQM